MEYDVASLQRLAESLKIVNVGNAVLEPGQELRPALAPDVTKLGVYEIQEGKLSLTWLTKDVRFDAPPADGSYFETDLTKAEILGGMPIPVVGSMGVPGSIHQLVGTVPILTDNKITVTLQVEWSLHANKVDAKGNDVPGDALAENKHYAAPAGTTVPAPVFALLPNFVEWTTDFNPSAGEKRWLKARVILRFGTAAYPAQPASSSEPPKWHELPPVKLTVLNLPFPTVVAFFTHRNFEPLGPLDRVPYDDGGAWIVVPERSALGTANLVLDEIGKLQKKLEPLRSMAAFVSVLIGGLGVLGAALGGQRNLHISVGNEFPNFDDIVVIQRPWHTNDTEAEDEFCAMIFIGAPGREISCYNHQYYDEDGGWFTLKTGLALHAVITDMWHKVPPVLPDQSLLTVKKEPPGTFAKILSSMKFTA